MLHDRVYLLLIYLECSSTFAAYRSTSLPLITESAHRLFVRNFASLGMAPIPPKAQNGTNGTTEHSGELACFYPDAKAVIITDGPSDDVDKACNFLSLERKLNTVNKSL